MATLVVLAGAVVQGSLGFGIALVAAPLLFLIDPMLVPGPMILASLAVSFLVYARDHADVDNGEIARVLPGAAIGVVFAGLVLRFLSRDVSVPRHRYWPIQSPPDLPDQGAARRQWP